MLSGGERAGFVVQIFFFLLQKLTFIRIVDEFLPGADVIAESDAGNLVVGVPRSCIDRLPLFFDRITKSPSTLDPSKFLLKEWGLKNTTLEEVFLRLVGNNHEEDIEGSTEQGIGEGGGNGIEEDEAFLIIERAIRNKENMRELMPMWDGILKGLKERGGGGGGKVEEVKVVEEEGIGENRVVAKSEGTIENDVQPAPTGVLESRTAPLHPTHPTHPTEPTDPTAPTPVPVSTFKVETLPNVEPAQVVISTPPPVSSLAPPPTFSSQLSGVLGKNLALQVSERSAGGGSWKRANLTD